MRSIPSVSYLYHKATPCSTLLLFVLGGVGNSPRSRGWNVASTSSIAMFFGVCSGARSGCSDGVEDDLENDHEKKLEEDADGG